MPGLALIVLLSACVVGRFPVPQPVTSAPDAHLPGASKLVNNMTNAELIALLPPSRQETAFHTTGGWVESPISIEWRKRVLAPGSVTPEEVAAAVRACGLLRSSPTCMEGEPYHVWLRMPEWLPGQVATAKAHTEHSSPATANAIDLGPGCGNAIAAQEEMEAFQAIGILPPGTTHVDFTLTLAPLQFWGGPKLAQSIELTLPVELISPATFTIAPIDSPELTALIRERSVTTFSFGGDYASIDNRMTRPLGGPLASTLVRINLQLLKDGEPVWSHIVRDPDDLYGEAAWDFGPERSITGDIVTDVHSREALTHYSVRVQGVAPKQEELIFSDFTGKQERHRPNQWHRKNYWNGSYTVPLLEIMEPGEVAKP